ncbi:NAD-dependent epimerase/dehydratase family protein [Dactylosporangium sp. CA-092794]|uniref:NAD-dependent epimerase/dehydratase family protein n=1 Tax=Dactylosporangium sp. CA-092794 TaxID=3239929 RepID=UPI003D8FA140
MILVTGGLGFIGSHTVRALVDLGEGCVLVQRRAGGPPAGLDGARVAVERADITDLPALLDIGSRHTITGIVHLAGSVPWPPGADRPVDGARKAIDSLLNVIAAAEAWGVPRVGVASTIGVYGGVAAEGALREDMPLPMIAGHIIPAFKKVGELLTDHLADATGIEIINYRISAVWGPLGRPASPFFAAPQLVHAAVRGAAPALGPLSPPVHAAVRGAAPDPGPLGLPVDAAVRGPAPDLGPLRPPVHAEDAIDLCYVKDCARAIALLQLAGRLHHRTYNVASGRATTNAEVIAAIRRVVPDARIDLPTGGTGQYTCLDITRIRQDTGYRPVYDAERAAADYIGWLRAGNER